MRLILFFVFILSTSIYGQEELKHIYTEEVFEPDLSKKAETELARQYELLDKKDLSIAEEKELQELLMQYGEVVEDIWQVIDGGCSWYCGGNNYKVEASSALKDYKQISYSAESANDNSYKTAWVENKEGPGIGESISYFFENKCPRVTAVIISNGYMKSDEAWANNNRVKTLKLIVNSEPYAVLHLLDSKTDQKFEVGTLGRRADGQDLILTFEIMEVYKGAKYDDTAITEVYFDGIDVH